MIRWNQKEVRFVSLKQNPMSHAFSLASAVMLASIALAPSPAPVPTLPPLHASPSPAASAWPPAPSISNEQMQKIDEIALGSLASQATAGMSIAVVKQGRVIYSRGYGFASIELQDGVRDSTLYEIGGITKEFTAASILQLVDDGRISLDDPLSKFVPGFPRAKDITVRELLNMTSGIPDYTDQPDFAKSVQNSTTPADIVATLKGLPLDFEPGTQWEYSNTNYVLLGMVIERASAKSYGNYLFDSVFRTLGMISTVYGNSGATSPNIATGYTFDGARLKPDTPWNLDWAYSAGGIVSNVLDLAVWDAALLQGKAVALPTLRTMWTPVSLKDGTNVPYGFGWTIESLYGHREIDDNGGLPGYNGRNATFPNDSFDIVVLANSQAFDAGPVVRQVFEVFYPPTKEQIDAQKQGDDAALARARDVFRRLQSGTLDASQLTARAAKRVTAKMLAQAKSSLGRLGAPTKFEQTDKYLFGTSTFYYYRLTFKQGQLRFSLSLDPAGKVGDVSVDPV